MRLGIQISSLQEHCQTAKDVRRTFKKAAKMGYTCAQLQWIGEEVSNEKIGEALEESGLACVGTQDFTHVVLPNLKTIIKQNRRLGGRSVCLSGIPEDAFSSEGLRAFARQVSDAAARAEDAGLRLAFHPRFQDYAPVDGFPAVDYLFLHADERLQMLVDVFHAKKAGFDPASRIRMFQGRADMAHFKDVKADGATLCPVGKGVLDFPSILTACRIAGIEYCFAEQEKFEGDAFDCMEESAKYLRKHGIMG